MNTQIIVLSNRVVAFDIVVSNADRAFTIDELNKRECDIFERETPQAATHTTRDAIILDIDENV